MNPKDSIIMRLIITSGMGPDRYSFEFSKWEHARLQKIFSGGGGGGGGGVLVPRWGLTENFNMAKINTDGPLKLVLSNVFSST